MKIIFSNAFAIKDNFEEKHVNKLFFVYMRNPTFMETFTTKINLKKLLIYVVLAMTDTTNLSNVL